MSSEPNLIFGEWSAWNFESCSGNEGNIRARKRWCSDGSTIKDPKCCYGELDYCQQPNKVPEIESTICQIMAYWGKWGKWSGDCSKVNTRRQRRQRRCVGGTAGKNDGCKNTTPMRKEVRLCGPKPTTMTTSIPPRAPATTTTMEATTTLPTTTITTTTRRTTKPMMLSDWIPYPPELKELMENLPDISNLAQER